jgi:TolA-binding protein
MTDLGELFDRVRAEQDELRSRGGHLQRLGERLEREAAPRQARRRPWILGLAAAALIFGALFLVTRAGELEVRIAGSSDRVPTGVWLGAPENQELALAFSDGTRVKLGSQAEARIVRLSSREVELELERGRASFQVAERRGSTFAVRAGPYTVRVTGTRFDVSWAPEDDAFVVGLHEGQVSLEGCGFGAGRQLAAGQTARAACQGSRVSIAYGDERARTRELASQSPASAQALERSPVGVARAGASEPETTAVDPAAAAKATRASGEPEKSGTDWKALSERGDHRQAMAAVEAAGFEAELGRATARDLVLLAEAAERAGALARARRALQSVRQRFAGSEEAAFATFALGRLEFDRFGAHAEAARWFGTYLDEQPSGPFAREALGRLMEALQRSGETGEARRLAQSYLRRYPSGPHAKVASRLAAEP